MSMQNKKNKAVATASVACGWAGAVMWGAGAVGGAIYTRASVTCDWAGVVMRKLFANVWAVAVTPPTPSLFTRQHRSCVIGQG